MGRPTMSRFQDMTFHASAAAVLALGWGAYFSYPEAFDHFGRFSIALFSIMWGVVCSSDMFRHVGDSRPSRAADISRPGPPAGAASSPCAEPVPVILAASRLPVPA